MSNVKKLSISFDPLTLDQVDAREGGRSTVIGRDLERYYAGLDRARAELRQKLSGEEVALIIDLFNATAWEPQSISYIWHEVEDGIRLDELDKKWKIDGPALIKKIKGLDYASCCALVDAAERFWAAVTAGEKPDPKKALG